VRWIGVIIVAPLWGMVSTQLFLQAWLAFINGIISIIGFLAGRVHRKISALGIGAGLGSAILFSLLLHAGQWLISDVLPFGYSAGENTVYWIFAAISGLYLLPQIPGRIKKSWRNSMVPGSIETGIMNRRLAEYKNDIHE
jgi:hypothetical protein